MTINQVAKAAGVGRGTASRVIEQMNVPVVGMYVDENHITRYNYSDKHCEKVIKKLKKLVAECQIKAKEFLA